MPEEPFKTLIDTVKPVNVGRYTMTMKNIFILTLGANHVILI